MDHFTPYEFRKTILVSDIYQNYGLGLETQVEECCTKHGKELVGFRPAKYREQYLSTDLSSVHTALKNFSDNQPVLVVKNTWKPRTFKFIEASPEPRRLERGEYGLDADGCIYGSHCGPSLSKYIPLTLVKDTD